MHSGAVCCAFCFVLVIILIIIFFVSIYEPGGGGGGGYYYGGGGGGYRSRGGGWGCFSESTLVWTKNETVPDTAAKEILIKNLREGDLVGTLEPSFHQSIEHNFMWTRATDVTISIGNWTAHTFEFWNGQHLTATSPHLMVILRRGKYYFTRADAVQINDQMVVHGVMAKVSNIRNHFLTRKVAVETEDGTVQVNGVLASGICDDNPVAVERIVKYESIIQDYKYAHFGKGYENTCMDRKAWKYAYMINNGYSE